MIFRIDLKFFIFVIFFYFTNQIEIYIIILISITIHEFSHLIFGLLFKKKIKAITLNPIGFSMEFQIDYSKENKNIKSEELKNLIIEIAGPASNILIILFTLVFNKNLTNIIYSNFIIAIFNLLPLYPLDGGRILNSIFILVTKKREHLEKLMQISHITMILISGIVVLCIFFLNNLKMLFTIFYLWYIFMKEKEIYRKEIKIQKILKHL